MRPTPSESTLMMQQQQDAKEAAIKRTASTPPRTQRCQHYKRTKSLHYHQTNPTSNSLCMQAGASRVQSVAPEVPSAGTACVICTQSACQLSIQANTLKVCVSDSNHKASAVQTPNAQACRWRPQAHADRISCAHPHVASCRKGLASRSFAQRRSLKSAKAPVVAPCTTYNTPACSRSRVAHLPPNSCLPVHVTTQSLSPGARQPTDKPHVASTCTAQNKVLVISRQSRPTE